MEFNLCPLVKYDLDHASFCRIRSHSVNLCEHFLYQIFSSSDKNKDWAVFSLHLLVKRGRGAYGRAVCWGTVLQAGKDWAVFSLHLLVKRGRGAYGRAVCWGTVLQAGRLRVQFLMVSLEFFIFLIVSAALWPWGWLSF